MLAAGTLLAADPKDAVSAAVKKLGDNYSWKQTMDMGGGMGGMGGGQPMVSQGKTANGVVWTSSEMMGNTTERLAKGTNTVTKGQDGKWQTPAEIAAAAAAAGGEGGGMGMGMGRGRGGFGGGMFGGAAALPAATVTDLIGQVKSLKEENGVISGDLTEEGAKAQSGFGGRRGGRAGGPGGPGGGMGMPEPTNAKASVKFWVKDGVLTKYELKSSSTMSFGGNDMQMDRTTTVEFNDVGKTKIDAPADVLKKIGA
jgi:hypothetical protein